MVKYITTPEAVSIINRVFNTNIEPRGDLKIYDEICKKLGLYKSTKLFTEKQLLDAIYYYEEYKLHKTLYEDNQFTT